MSITSFLCDVQEAGMELVSQVREGLRQRMMEVDWLDSTTRQRAIEKVKLLLHDEIGLCVISYKMPSWRP